MRENGALETVGKRLRCCRYQHTIRQARVQLTLAGHFSKRQRRGVTCAAHLARDENLKLAGRNIVFPHSTGNAGLSTCVASIKIRKRPLPPLKQIP